MLKTGHLPRVFLFPVFLFLALAVGGVGRLRAASEASVALSPDAPTMTQGPIVGAVTSSTAIVWSRASTSAQVNLQYSTNSNLSGASTSTTVNTGSSSDFTAKVPLSGLTASTTYYYTVLVNGASQLSSPYPSFKTFPPEGQDVPFKMVYLTDFCCFPHDPYNFPPTNTFSNAIGENPDWVFIGGDFNHSDPSGGSPSTALAAKRSMFQNLYTTANNWSDFISILRRFPVVHQWDDHDSGQNNSDKTYPYWAQTYQAQNEYFPMYPITQYGDWQDVRYGNAEFFVEDDRSQRDPNGTPDGPNKSMLDGNNLGSAGELVWLEQGLLNSTATWKFMMSSIAWNPTVPKTDSWNGFQYEQRQIVNFINSHGIKNVIVLSGDLHVGAIDDGTNAYFPEMISPSANLMNSGTYECLTANGTGTWSVGFYGNNIGNPCPGYGVVSVLTNPDRVLLQDKDSNGNVKISYTVQSSGGGPTPTPGATNTPGPTPTSTQTATPGPTQTQTPTATPTSRGNVLINPGFESGPGVGWTEHSGGGFELIDTTNPHTGFFSADLCGYNNCNDRIQQQITIPSGANLSYWRYMQTNESGNTPFDFLYVRLYSPGGGLVATLRTWSNVGTQGVWSQDTISLSAYAGQTLGIRFQSTTDGSRPTRWWIDDTSVQ